MAEVANVATAPAVMEKVAIDSADSVANSTNDNKLQGEYADVPLKLSRKDQLWLDLRVVPMLGLLYLIIFLDRSNIANARIEGLTTSLHMPANGFNTAIWIFYLPFVIVQVPSNILLSMPRIRPSLFLGTATFLLGVISMCQGFTRSYGGLLACRFFMGIFEAALPAGASLLLASYYTKRELSARFAWFFVFSESGPCFSGLLAYAIENLNGKAGYEGWRWIFIIEGLMTIFFGLVALVFVPHFPQKANFLSEEQRAILLAKLDADRGAEKQDMSDVNWKMVLTDWRIWLMTLLFFCTDMTASSMSNFLPTILKELGWTASRAQVMTIPVWIFGMFCEVTVAHIADRFGHRLYFNAATGLVALVGWAIQRGYPAAPGVRYFGLFLMAGGAFPQFPLLGGGLGSNLRGRAYLAVGMALQAGIGNTCNFVSSNVFITGEAPHYHTGFNTGLSITALGVVMSLVTAYIFQAHNKNLDRKRAAGEIDQADDQYNYKLHI